MDQQLQRLCLASDVHSGQTACRATRSYLWQCLATLGRGVRLGNRAAPGRATRRRIRLAGARLAAAPGRRAGAGLYLVGVASALPASELVAPNVLDTASLRKATPAIRGRRLRGPRSAGDRADRIASRHVPGHPDVVARHQDHVDLVAAVHGRSLRDPGAGCACRRHARPDHQRREITMHAEGLERGRPATRGVRRAHQLEVRRCVEMGPREPIAD
mmetsp:Transcript_177397/g.568851  ORF Transcript_177397/g.568851 Transcript_177397/m.568851 type:complete len:216 (-) Transcript_177397:184-831(-)